MTHFTKVVIKIFLVVTPVTSKRIQSWPDHTIGLLKLGQEKMTNNENGSFLASFLQFLSLLLWEWLIAGYNKDKTSCC